MEVKAFFCNITMCMCLNPAISEIVLLQSSVRKRFMGVAIQSFMRLTISGADLKSFYLK